MFNSIKISLPDKKTLGPLISKPSHCPNLSPPSSCLVLLSIILQEFFQYAYSILYHPNRFVTQHFGLFLTSAGDPSKSPLFSQNLNINLPVLDPESARSQTWTLIDSKDISGLLGWCSWHLKILIWIDAFTLRIQNLMKKAC